MRNNKRTIFSVFFYILGMIFFTPSVAYADCATVTMGNKPAGHMFYNEDQKLFQYCDGTNWIPMHPIGSGSGGCTTVAMGPQPEGKLFYNQDARVLQGCAGDTWMAMGPVGGGSAGSWAQVSAGSNHSCAVKTDGTLWCWGSDANGKLGNGAVTESQSSPVQETTAATDWAQVAAGDNHSCAVKTDGTLWCWGEDDYGALGNGAAGDQDSPMQETTAATDWAQVSAGISHTCAVKTDATLWCWGRDDWGQLGNGAVTGNQESPVQETTSATDWAQVSVGGRHSCAIKTDDTLWCWGLDDEGQLGNGATGDQDSPMQEDTAATNWARVSAGGDHSCAVKTDGTLWCWGKDDWGQLGNGAVTGNQHSPVQEATSATNWAQVSATSQNSGYQRHTCAVKVSVRPDPPYRSGFCSAEMV